MSITNHSLLTAGSPPRPDAKRSLPAITLIVPALNEERLIVETVEQIIDVVKGRFAEYEVLLIDDGSTDATGSLMDGLAGRNQRIHVIHNPKNIGLGSSYHLGVDRARHE